MNRGQEIRGADGVIYTVISRKGYLTLLSHESAEGSCFVVAWPVTPSRGGSFSWLRTRDFGADLHRANRYLDEKATAGRRAVT